VRRAAGFPMVATLPDAIELVQKTVNRLHRHFLGRPVK